MVNYREIPFSVAMSIYKNDNPTQLGQALKSICEQSCPPTEIYLVEDGPISDELDTVVNGFAEKYGNFTINKLPQNGGLGNALKIAVENCRYDLIARMDSDDISAPGRFEKQLRAYVEKPADVLGGWTLGFVGDIHSGKVSAAKRKLNHEEIISQIGKKSPMSHVTVLFNRNAVMKAGNYPDLYYHEDYYLWAKMINAGCSFRNIPEYLVYVRLGENQARRHGGIKYYKAEHYLQKYMLHTNLMSFGLFCKETLIRIVYQVLITPRIRNFIAMKIKRKYLSRKEVDEIIAKNIEEDQIFQKIKADSFKMQ